MKQFAIIVAGGIGSRMNADLPKQFLEIGGKPILQWTIEAFIKCSNSVEIVVSIHPEYIDFWKKKCDEINFRSRYRIVNGGVNRFHSVKNALDVLPDNGLVAIHDAVRPCISKSFIEYCYSEAHIHFSAIPAIDLVDSIREIDRNNSRLVDRNKLKAIQTPQVFYLDKIKEAYNFASHSKFTDDATVFESCGFNINLIDGERQNIKITHDYDQIIAEIFLRKLQTNFK